MNLAEIFREELKESMGRKFLLELNRCDSLEDYENLKRRYAAKYGGEDLKEKE